MQVAFGTEHHAAVFQNSDERLVGVLEEHSLDRLNVIDEMTIKTDAVYDWQIVRLAECQIVNTIGRRGVDDAGTAFCTHEVGREDLERVSRVDINVIEELFVTCADELRAFDRLHDRMLDVTEHGFAKRFRNNQDLAFRLAEAVVDIRANCERQV